MIPRFKPHLDSAELAAALAPGGASVETFEREFARVFEASDAIAYSYGRSALWSLFKALGIEQAEVVIPAYTCVVAAHAIVLSGNTCRFVDVSLRDYNMDLDQLERALTPRTRCVIATHLFGYPLDCDRLRTIVADAEQRFGTQILVVHDCAHSFGARWKGRLVCNEGDAALFGLGVSKMITSIFGGMLTTNAASIAERARAHRQAAFHPAPSGKALVRRAYLLATFAALSRPVYAGVRWIEHETPLLDRVSKAYHLDDLIHFPPDHLDLMTGVEARVGLAQLRKYPEIVARHIAHAKYYDERLQGIDGWELPPIVEGATYSHYVVRVPDRDAIVARLARRGIDIGELIQYSVPHMPAYRGSGGEDCVNSLLASRHTINLPVNADLTDADRARIVWAVREVAAECAHTRPALAS